MGIFFNGAHRHDRRNGCEAVATVNDFAKVPNDHGTGRCRQALAVGIQKSSQKKEKEVNRLGEERI